MEQEGKPAVSALPAVLGKGFALLLAVLGLAAAVLAWLRIPLGTPNDPGPGSVPLTLGLGVATLGVAAALARAWPAAAAFDGRRALTVAAVVAGWALALPRLGFAVTTMVALFLLGRAVDRVPLPRLLVFALLTGGGAVALFRGLLKMPLPRGPWGW